MRYYWLANNTGHVNAFFRFDIIQEHKIRDIKVRHYLLQFIPNTLISPVVYLHDSWPLRHMGLYPKDLRIHSYATQNQRSS
jgi:hypothetical protein